MGLGLQPSLEMGSGLTLAWGRVEYGIGSRGRVRVKCIARTGSNIGAEIEGLPLGLGSVPMLMPWMEWGLSLELKLE